eukprot:279809-Pyramimonas_sp.AAC.1
MPAVAAREGGQCVTDVLDFLGFQLPGNAGTPAVEATDKDKGFASESSEGAGEESESEGGDGVEEQYFA